MSEELEFAKDIPGALTEDSERTKLLSAASDLLKGTGSIEYYEMRKESYAASPEHLIELLEKTYSRADCRFLKTPRLSAQTILSEAAGKRNEEAFFNAGNAISRNVKSKRGNMTDIQKINAQIKSLCKRETRVNDARQTIKKNLIRNRCLEMNKSFEWTDEHIAQFKELDDFLRQKQSELFKRVKETENTMKEILAKKPDFLGGEFQIDGALKLEAPYDESLILQGLSEEQFSLMVEFTNPYLLEIGCSSYRPLEGESEKDARDLVETGIAFPEGHIPPVMKSCMTLWQLCSAKTFSFKDLLDLDKSIFGISISINNFF